MHRRATLSVVAAGGALALVAACGTAKPAASNDSSAPPKTEFTHAIGALAKSSALTTTLSLNTTGADIQRIASQGGGSSGLTNAQANAVAGAHITLEVLAPKGKTIADAGKSPAQAASSVTAGSGTATYLSIREVNSTLYLQVDLKDLLTVAGQGSEFANLQAEVASFPAFVKALVAGKWVSLSLATIKSLESFIGGAANAKIPSTAQAQQLVSKLESAILGDLTATRLSKGTTDHLVISGNLRTLATSILSAVSTAIPAAASLGTSAAHAVPNQSIKFDAFVTGGALSKLTFDPGQFSKTKHFSLPIVATFTRTGAPISAPAGAVAIDLGQLGSLIGAVNGGSSSLGGGTSAPDFVSPSPVS